jgi:class 3 adenylate cyclase
MEGLLLEITGWASVISGGMRRLSTIMFTDIVGYSAMMERDEKGTLELLEQHNAIVQGQVEKFGGTTIKTIGDSFMVDFNSVVDAVECAFSIQEACGPFNAARGESQPKLQLRIGIHVGDVIFQGNDVFGDGVNVAQRIQSQAEPGSICISEEVFKLIEKKMPIHFRLIGEKKLKNIERPMRVYVSGSPGMPATISGPAKSSGWTALLTGCILGLLLVGGILWYYYFYSKKTPAKPVVVASSTSPGPSALPAEKPAPVASKRDVSMPPKAAIEEHIRKNLFADLARELSPPEVLSIGNIKSDMAEANLDGKGRVKVGADVTVEQTQDLFAPYDFQAGVKEMGYNPDTYRNALAEAAKISADLAASAPKEENPTLIKRTTGKGFERVVPVEFGAAPDGSDWNFGPIKIRAGEKPPEGFRGQPMSAFPQGALVVGSEQAMQAIGSYIQAREGFTARVLVKKTHLQVSQEEEAKSLKDKQEAELVSRFTVGELYDGVMVDGGNNHYQVIFMVIENKNGGELLTATIALGGEPGILRSLTGRIEVVEKDEKKIGQATLTTLANTGVAPSSGVPDFFHKGKNVALTFKMTGDRLEGSGGSYSFKLNKSKD